MGHLIAEAFRAAVAIARAGGLKCEDRDEHIGEAQHPAERVIASPTQQSSSGLVRPEGYSSRLHFNTVLEGAREPPPGRIDGRPVAENRVQRSVHPRPTDVPPAYAEGRVLVIPGLDKDPSMVRAAAPSLFRGMRVLLFDHRFVAFGLAFTETRNSAAHLAGCSPGQAPVA